MLAADLAHRVDDLVGRDRELDARHRHLDRRERDRRAGRVAEHAGQLDEAAERIADEAERALLRERDGMADLSRRAAEHLDGGAGGHPRRRARLRLTAALRARQRRALRDDRADESRRRERVDEALVVDVRALRRVR